MTSRGALGLPCLIAATSATRGDEPKGEATKGRVVEGRIVAAGASVEGARDLFGPADRGFVLVEGASATTDAEGRYRADLVKFPWSSAAVRAPVMAPGFEADERRVAPGAGAATADFEPRARPWKETRIRLEDPSGRPVAGVEVARSVGAVGWARLKTDARVAARWRWRPSSGSAWPRRPRGPGRSRRPWP